jgi:hypothetical protein
MAVEVDHMVSYIIVGSSAAAAAITHDVLDRLDGGFGGRDPGPIFLLLVRQLGR